MLLIATFAIGYFFVIMQTSVLLRGGSFALSVARLNVRYACIIMVSLPATCNAIARHDYRESSDGEMNQVPRGMTWVRIKTIIIK